MELRPVKSKSKQDYPVFDDYWKNRRHYVKEAALCAGIALSAGILASCDEQKPRVDGGTAAPQQPVTQPQSGTAAAPGNTPKNQVPNTGSAETPPMPPGSMPAPSNVESTVKLGGDMAVPEKPVEPMPEPVEVKIRGEMVAPVAPVPPEGKIMGKMVAPKAPEKE